MQTLALQAKEYEGILCFFYEKNTHIHQVIVSYILTAITCHIFIALAFGLSKLKQRYPKGIRHIELWRETLTNMAIASNLQQSYLGLALQVTAWARLGSKNDLSYYHFRIMAAIIILPLLTHTATVATFDRRLRKHTGPFLLNYISMGLNALAAISLLLINVIGWRYPPSALVGTSLHCGIDESIESEFGLSHGLQISLWTSLIPGFFRRLFNSSVFRDDSVTPRSC